MNRISAIIKIIRPANVIITFFVVLVSSLICSDKIFNLAEIIFAALSASFILAAGNVINDIFDFKIDLINKPFRPLPAKELSIEQAKNLYLIFTFIGLLLSYGISKSAFAIVIFTGLLLFFYSYSLKKIPLLGNITVAFCTGLAFIFGGVAVNNWQYAIIPAVFGFLINLIREIVKDVEDLKGDTENKVVTFPAKYGIHVTKNLLIFLIILLIASTFYPFVFKIYKIEYFLIVLFTVDLILVFILQKLISKSFESKISQVSNLLKISMIFGLLAIYLGKY